MTEERDQRLEKAFQKVDLVKASKGYLKTAQEDLRRIRETRSKSLDPRLSRHTGLRL